MEAGGGRQSWRNAKLVLPVDGVMARYREDWRVVVHVWRRVRDDVRLRVRKGEFFFIVVILVEWLKSGVKLGRMLRMTEVNKSVWKNVRNIKLGGVLVIFNVGKNVRTNVGDILKVRKC